MPEIHPNLPLSKGGMNSEALLNLPPNTELSPDTIKIISREGTAADYNLWNPLLALKDGLASNAGTFDKVQTDRLTTVIETLTEDPARFFELHEGQSPLEILQSIMRNHLFVGNENWPEELTKLKQSEPDKFNLLVGCFDAIRNAYSQKNDDGSYKFGQTFFWGLKSVLANFNPGDVAESRTRMTTYFHNLEEGLLAANLCEKSGESDYSIPRATAAQPI